MFHSYVDLPESNAISVSVLNDPMKHLKKGSQPFSRSVSVQDQTALKQQLEELEAAKNDPI